LNKVIRGRDRFIVCPKSLILPDEIVHGARVLRISDHFFNNYPYGYNRLLLRHLFYRFFSGYRFMLVYQLDCLVFRDELERFVDMGFDYIGSPWFMNEALELVQAPVSVGNGGFSLRKVSTARHVLTMPMKRGTYFPKPPANVPQPRGMKWFKWNLLRRSRQHLGLWRVQDELENYFENEDVFWSFIAPKIYPSYRKAGLEAALEFSLELNPRLCVELNGGRVPFGCHAWWKHDREFVESMMASEFAGGGRQIRA